MFTDAQRRLYYQAKGLHVTAINEIEEMRACSPARRPSQRGLRNTIVEFYSQKNQRQWLLESYTGEFLYALHMEVFGECGEYYAQVQPKNIVRNSRTSSITVDFMVFDRDGIRFIECKPRSWLQELSKDKPNEWVHCDGFWRRPPVDTWAEERGVAYSIWSPPEPHGVYQANLLALYGVVSTLGLPDVDSVSVRRLCKVLHQAPLSIRSALDRIPGLSGVHILSALANSVVFGTLQSVLIDDPDRFMLFADKRQAVTCDEQLLFQLRGSIAQPSVESDLLLASTTDYTMAQRRLARVNRILNGLEQTTRRYMPLVRDVLRARSSGGSELEVCLTHYARSGRHIGQLTRDQEHEIGEAIAQYRRDPLVRTKVQAHDHLVITCNRRGIRPPSRTTFSNRLRKYSDLKRAYAVGGNRGFHAAECASDPGDRTLRSSVPGLMVHVDSTKFDLRCSPDFLATLGFDCPTLYLAMDSATAKPLGCAVLFGPSCRNALGVLIRDIFHRQGSLPRYWIADGGSEYRGHWFSDFCALFGSTRIQPPPGTPRRNSLAENALGRVNSELAHRFLGSTLPDQKGRSVTSRQKSYATACHRYATIVDHLEKYLFEDVPATPLPSTRFSPQERQDELVGLYGATGVVKVNSREDFLIATSVPIDRDVTADPRRGIRYLQRTFVSAELMQHLRFQKPTEMRMDCVDPNRMYVRFSSRWVLAMTARSLVTGGRGIAETLFETMSDSRLRSEAAQLRDQRRRERTERIAEANLAAKASSHLVYMLEAANDEKTKESVSGNWTDPSAPLDPFFIESGEP